MKRPESLSDVLVNFLGAQEKRKQDLIVESLSIPPTAKQILDAAGELERTKESFNSSRKEIVQAFSKLSEELNRRGVKLPTFDELAEFAVKSKTLKSKTLHSFDEAIDDEDLGPLSVDNDPFREMRRLGGSANGVLGILDDDFPISNLRYSGDRGGIEMDEGAPIGWSDFIRTSDPRSRIPFKMVINSFKRSGFENMGMVREWNPDKTKIRLIGPKLTVLAQAAFKATPKPDSVGNV